MNRARKPQVEWYMGGHAATSGEDARAEVVAPADQTRSAHPIAAARPARVRSAASPIAAPRPVRVHRPWLACAALWVVLFVAAITVPEASAATTASAARPTDDAFSLQWGLENRGQRVLGVAGTAGADVDALGAWRVTRGAGATVGVVDSGLDARSGVRLGGASVSLLDTDPSPADAHGHGTALAGIIAAPADGAGVVGLAPEAGVVSFRVLDGGGHGSTTALAAALDRAGELGLRVVNASVSGEDAPELRAAIAAHPQTLYVVAAGNEGTDQSVRATYPCSDPAPNVLCVGASDAQDRPLALSNTGAEAVDLFAPGGAILSDWTGGRLAYDSGTSMAAGFVSAAAALLLATNPGLSTAEVKAALMGSVDRRAALGASVTGGRLDAAAALAAIGARPAATTATTTRAASRSVKRTRSAAARAAR